MFDGPGVLPLYLMSTGPRRAGGGPLAVPLAGGCSVRSGLTAAASPRHRVFRRVHRWRPLPAVPGGSSDLRASPAAAGSRLRDGYTAATTVPPFEDVVIQALSNWRADRRAYSRRERP